MMRNVFDLEIPIVYVRCYIGKWQKKNPPSRYLQVILCASEHDSSTRGLESRDNCPFQLSISVCSLISDFISLFVFATDTGGAGR